MDNWVSTRQLSADYVAEVEAAFHVIYECAALGRRKNLQFFGPRGVSDSSSKLIEKEDKYDI